MLFDFCALIQIMAASQLLHPGLQASPAWNAQATKVDSACTAQQKEAEEKAKKPEKKK